MAASISSTIEFEEEEEEEMFYSDDEFSTEFAVEHGLEILPPSLSSNIRLDPRQIAEMRAAEVARISGILCLDESVVTQLLNHYNWNGEKVLEQYIEDADDVLKKAGLEVLVGRVEEARPLKDDTLYECGVCFTEQPGAKMMKLACQHIFCMGCWRQYLSGQVKDGASIGIECMEYKCKILVDEATMNKLVPKRLFEKWSTLCENAFVDSNPQLKWCPAPGCGNAVRVTLLSSKDVVCKCGFKFCFQCNLEAHFPASCKEMEMWRVKCEDDSETFNWLKSNTQDCPKCHSAIEKNGGCNHMTCRRQGCGHEFCWICLGDYRSHTSCNRFKEGDASTKTTARESLERYLHYFNRYVRHEQSKKFELDLRTKAQKSMEQILSSSERWMDAQYILTATEQMIECRRTLKYTYVRGFYMESGPEKNLYEFLQEDLERTTELLSGELEKPAEKYERRSIIDVCNLARRRLQNLLNGVEEGLTSASEAFGSSANKVY